MTNKQCFFFDGDEFDCFIQKITNGNACVSYSLEGIDYIVSEAYERGYEAEDIQSLVSKVLEVEVTSIHIDDCEYPVGVWVVYKGEQTKANENLAAYMTAENAIKDRKLFVHNLGQLLRQAADGVVSAELDDKGLVTITYEGGGTHTVNVLGDSYSAIVQDVAKGVR